MLQSWASTSARGTPSPTLCVLSCLCLNLDGPLARVQARSERKGDRDVHLENVALSIRFPSVHGLNCVKRRGGTRPAHGDARGFTGQAIPSSPVPTGAALGLQPAACV